MRVRLLCAVLLAFVAGGGAIVGLLLFYPPRQARQEAGAIADDVPAAGCRVTVAQPQLPHTVDAEVVSSNTGRVFLTDSMLGFWVFTDVTLRDHPKLGALRASMQRQITYARSKVSARPFMSLRNISIWISPRYDGHPHRSEYHIGPGWLQSQRRPVEMADSVEVTSIDVVDSEDRRMPLWLFHELAHGYHFCYMSPEKKRAVRAQFEQARRDGRYTDVPAYDGAGNLTTRSSYPVKNEYEYFAELSEDYIGAGDMRNDIWPFRSDALLANDRAAYELMRSIWNV